MTPEEKTYCDAFIAKWKKTLTGGMAGLILKTKYGKLTPEARSAALRPYIFDAKELSDAAGKTLEMREYVFAESCRLIEELLGNKK